MAHPTVTARARTPSFVKLVAAFPDMMSVVEVKTLIGGAADDTNAVPSQQRLGGAHGDTCTLRMSRTFNCSGTSVPGNVFDIVFGLNDDGVSRAPGHADLRDGATFFAEVHGISTPRRDFFSIANAVSLRVAPGDGTLPAAGP